MEELGYGKGYLYPHDYENAIVKQAYLPEELKGRRYYRPTDRGHEKRLKDFMEKVRRLSREK
jgi:putative ATPase